MRRHQSGPNKWIVAVCFFMTANFLFWSAGCLSKNVLVAGAAKWESVKNLRFEPASDEVFETLSASDVKVQVQETGSVSLARSDTERIR
jgi:hypothetical protein